METSENLVTNTEVIKNEMLDTYEIHTKLLACHSMQVDGSYFEEHEVEIKTFNENKLKDFIRRSYNKPIIDKYSDMFSSIINKSQANYNGIPQAANIRDEIEQTILDLLFDLGFHPEIINDIRLRMKR